MLAELVSPPPHRSAAKVETIPGQGPKRWCPFRPRPALISKSDHTKTQRKIFTFAVHRAIGGERERERERERETETETETQRDAERRRETQRDAERRGETQRDAERHRETQRDTERHRERERDRERERERERGGKWVLKAGGIR